MLDDILLKSTRQQRLWPSIHAAVDVYQRRRACGADHYERIWRLIHIWECTVITLASASLAKIKALDNTQDLYLKLRERCYGLVWNATERSLIKEQGALDGSIDRWIDILQLVAGLQHSDCHFLQGLKIFLKPTQKPSGASGIDFGPLTKAWARTCDVPSTVSSENLGALEALRIVNSFRNRFAHVPFPYDQLEMLADELYKCTESLFEVHPPTQEGCPLVGAFVLEESLLQGSGFRKRPPDWTSVQEMSFFWEYEKSSFDVWPASPFIYLDKMMRSYLLTRVKDAEGGSLEYTRYLAETNSVITRIYDNFLSVLPKPSEVDYIEDAIESDSSLSETPSREVRTREAALEAMRREDFEPAIDFWKQTVIDNPQYHSGWSRLGLAQREWAVRLKDQDPARSVQMLKDSVESLDKAVDHSEPRYSAEAFYNRSKSKWRLWQLTDERELLTQALVDARDAVESFPAEHFLSWLEFMQETSARTGDQIGPPSLSTGVQLGTPTLS